MKISKCLILVIATIILFIIYYYPINRIVEKSLIKQISEGCCQYIFSPDNLPLTPINGGIEFTFSFWIYIASWEYKYDKEKIILYWKGKNIKEQILLNTSHPLFVEKCIKKETKHMYGKYGGLKVYLDKKSNNLIVDYTLMDGSTESITVENIPLQKWLNIIVLLRLRNLDVFLNGALIANKFLNKVPLYGKHKLIVNSKKGFDGYISKLKYYNKAISYPEIKRIFKNGQ